MLFTTSKYWLFLTIVFFVYWAVAKRRRLAVLTILLASYYFYALWNPTFVPLLIAISSIDFLTARGITASTNARLRRLLLFTSIVTDIGTLVVFKYFNFFSASATTLLEAAPHTNEVFPHRGPRHSSRLIVHHFSLAELRNRRLSQNHEAH